MNKRINMIQKLLLIFTLLFNFILHTYLNDSPFKYYSIKCKYKTFSSTLQSNFQVGIYLFKVKNENTNTISEICSKLTIKN